MNFNPELTSAISIILSLSAAFMWGSWFISLKNIKDFPIDGFYVILFTTSFIFVWTIGLAIDGRALFLNIKDVLETDPFRVYVSFGAGLGYVLGMRVSLWVMKTIGLSLSQPIMASFNIIVGVLVTTLIGGIPENFSWPRVLVAVSFFAAAIFLSMFAAQKRSISQKNGVVKSKLIYDMKDVWKAIAAIILILPLRPAYTLGLSYGLASVTHSEGLAVLPYMALLVSGAYTSCIIVSGSQLTIRKQWGLVFKSPFSIIKWGIISGLAHYGGNIIHTFATASLSSALSWPLGMTSGLWTQFWGLVYGEYTGSPRKVYILIFSAFSFYIIGAYLIASQTF